MERYLSKIAPPDENGCRIWTAGHDTDGYGRFGVDGYTYPAHVWGYRQLVGPIAPGMFVCHACDNRGCQEPSHWWLGTPAENNADRDAKGRLNHRGELNPSAKLTWEQVAEIRDLASTGEFTCTAIANLFDMNVRTVWLVVRNKTWVV